MNILIAGANGYIAQRLIPVLLEQGHQLHCCVRNRRRFETAHSHKNVSVVEVDWLEVPDGGIVPENIDAAFYLVHSMSDAGDFEKKEILSAKNFLAVIAATSCRQIIYLGGIANHSNLSKHLQSRLQVEQILGGGNIPLTALRAGIIVGSGSASFEIIRDLVEKLPFMIAPKWLSTLCQPIAIRNVIQFLSGVLLHQHCMGRQFDIGGPDVLSYKQMLMQFAEVRRLKRLIVTVPVMSPRLSSYWLYFVTSTSYPLAVNLVNSLHVPVIAKNNDLATLLQVKLIPYKEAVELAFTKIEQNEVVSSWKDAFVSSNTAQQLMDYVQVPKNGVFTDEKFRNITGNVGPVLQKIWRIGGRTGWYYGNWMWRLRGQMDKAAGGVGLRRGRRSAIHIKAGDALDFWRVLVADEAAKRLLLFAEMRLPGEAWLEFEISEKEGKHLLRQTATFRPRGLLGRLYWYVMLPFHYFIFDGMIGRIARSGKSVGASGVGI